MNSLTHKNAVIIGGCGGIGIEICRVLVEAGVTKLGVIDVHEDLQIETILGNNSPDLIFVYQKASVIEKEHLGKVLEQIKTKLGQIQILINAAGIVDEQNPERTFSINTFGTINSTLIGIELMRKDKAGSGGIIVNIGSVASYTPTFRTPIYTASKYAVLGFTLSLAQPELQEKTGVTLTIVCPGSTKTAITQYVAKQPAIFPEFGDAYKKFSKSCTSQSPNQAAKGILEAINANENGSIWEVIGGNIKKINL